MRMKDKIAPYVEQGMNAMQIHILHPEWNYNTIYSAMHPEMCKKKKRTEEIVERPKGWNADKKACKTCQYRGRGTSSGTSSQNGCNYILAAGHSRGCKVADCDKYIKGKQIRLNPKCGCNEQESTDMEMQKWDGQTKQ